MRYTRERFIADLVKQSHRWKTKCSAHSLLHLQEQRRNGGLYFALQQKAGISSLPEMERLEHTDVEYLTFMLINVNALIIWITRYNILKEKCITDKEYTDTDSAPQNRPLKV